MALVRSNSLSLNTSAVNSSFAQQNQQPATGGSAFGGSLFGNQTQAAKPQTTGLFGAAATTQPAQGGGLFGTTATTQSTQGGGLFGAATTAQPVQGGGLFGATKQPAPTTGLFGASTTTTTQPAQAGGLFGGNTTNNTQSSTGLFGTQTTQPATVGGLFGGSLFGGQNQSNAMSNKSTGLFGASQPAPASTGLFGASQPAQANTGLFGASQNTATQQQPQQQAPSLLGASRYTLGQPAPFTGRLTMGQGVAAQSTTTPATKLDWTNVRGTTRYSDLVEGAQQTIETIDNMVKQQEMFCKQIEAFLPPHSTNLQSLQPDIVLITDKANEAEQALITDAQRINQVKIVSQKDTKDILRCERIGENLRLPAQYQYAPAAGGYAGRKNSTTASNDAVLEEEYDMNLLGNYFIPMAAEMQTLINNYTSNLSEIENHLQTLEATAIAQQQARIQQRTSGTAQDQIQELSDTLRAFESTIMHTAAKVGGAREGITELSLGRSRSGKGS